MDKYLSNLKYPEFLSNWRWLSFLEYTIDSFSRFDSYKYDIPVKFINNKSYFGSKSKQLEANLFTLAFKINKIRQARIACVDAGSTASVLNFVVSPCKNFNLPFFGADFVTLPTGHLIAIDLQPALKSDTKHTEKVWKRLKPIHNKWKNLIPSGGPIPEDAKPYFSPGFLWTRIPLGSEGDQLINHVVFKAYNDYLSLYLDLLFESVEIDYDYSLKLLNGQKRYMDFRAYKDPARGMLTRFFGKDWTESYITEVLFNLENN